MKHGSHTGDDSPSAINSIDTLNELFQIGSVQARPEPASLAEHRIDDDDIDDIAALVRQLQVAQEFDDAEAIENRERPEPLSGGPAARCQQYVVEGQSPQEWLVTNHTVAVGCER